MKEYLPVFQMCGKILGNPRACGQKAAEYVHSRWRSLEKDGSTTGVNEITFLNIIIWFFKIIFHSS